MKKKDLGKNNAPVRQAKGNYKAKRKKASPGRLGYRLMRITAIGIMLAALLVTAAASSAFWTDMVSLGEEVEAFDIGIEYGDDITQINSFKPYLPGDSHEFLFTVVNSGDISVDIKPVMTVEASGDMAVNESGFIIADAEGNEIGGYEKTYYDADGVKLSEEEAADGALYRKAVYTMDGEDVLAGAKQKEITEGEENLSREYTYCLKLLDTTGNEFKGQTVSLDVSTYAIQHRNREADTEWISIAGEN